MLIIKKAFLLLLFPALALCHPNHTGSTTVNEYYVATDGNDLNNGTSISTPFLTIDKANSTVTPGAIVWIRAGTYDEIISPATTGTKAGPITYAAYQNEVVDVNGTIGLQLNNKDYIHVKGITFSNCTARWTIWSNSSYAYLEDCIFKDPVRSGAFYTFFNTYGMKYSVFNNCSWDAGNLQAVAETNIEHDLIGLNHESKGNLFYRCDFKDIPHGPIQGWADKDQDDVSYNVLWECTSTNRWRHGISANTGYGDQGYWLVHGCTSSDVGVDGESNPSTENQGNLTPGIYLRGDGNICRYNTVYRCGIGIFGRASDPNTRIYHNTVYDTRDYGSNQFFGVPLFYEHEYNVADQYVDLLADEIEVKNNIFWKAAHAQQAIIYSYWLVSGWLGNDFSYNVFGDPTAASSIRIDESGSTAGQTGTLTVIEAASSDWHDNLSSDPQMVDPDRQDFSLKPGSPCIDAATHLTMTNGSGSGSASMIVDDAHYFFTKGSPWNIKSNLIQSDTIYVEDMGMVEIVAIDYATNTLTLSSPQTWGDGKKVYYLKDGRMYTGAAPDIGAYEYGQNRKTSGPSVPFVF